MGGPGSGPPLTREKVAQIRELRADGHTLKHVATVVGCHWWTVRKYAPGYIGKVPVAPLREAFLASPMTAADVARELGWWCTNDKGTIADSSRVKRTLGILPDVHGSNGDRCVSWRTLVDAETVALIAEAIGVSPWAVLPDDESDAA